MTASIFLSVCVLLAAEPDKDAERPRHPLAPSLPRLTKEEEARYEGIVERFVLFDIGKLRGAEGKKAFEDFKALPPEAIFVLIDGFNEAANREDACPAVIIGKKITSILNASDDLELLAFAKENMGAGVKSKRHQGLLRDMQFSVQLRKGAVQRRLAVAGIDGKMPGSMSLADLGKVLESQKAPQVRAALAEIDRRQGPKVFELLAIAAASPEGDVQKLGLVLLGKRLAKQTPPQLKDLLKNERPEVKIAAAKEIGGRNLRYGSELIELFGDSEPAVQQAARAALIQLGKNTVDYGPQPTDSIGERETAVRLWREWWAKQASR